MAHFLPPEHKVNKLEWPNQKLKKMIGIAFSSFSTAYTLSANLSFILSKGRKN